jgi:hypothetical protein
MLLRQVFWLLPKAMSKQAELLDCFLGKGPQKTKLLGISYHAASWPEFVQLGPPK